MHYILDGYNIINCSKYLQLFYAPTLEQRRGKLCDFIKINRPHGSRNNSITIAFDCRVKPNFEFYDYSRHYDGEIEIIFSEDGQTADDIISQECEDSQTPNQIIVVTNDKGIHRRIALSGARHESVETFIARGYKAKSAKCAEKILRDEIREKINKELKEKWL